MKKLQRNSTLVFQRGQDQRGMPTSRSRPRRTSRPTLGDVSERGRGGDRRCQLRVSEQKDQVQSSPNALSFILCVLIKWHCYIVWLRFDQGIYAAECSRNVKAPSKKPFATVEIPTESVRPLLAPRGKMANCCICLLVVESEMFVANVLAWHVELYGCKRRL